MISQIRLCKNQTKILKATHEGHGPTINIMAIFKKLVVDGYDRKAIMVMPPTTCNENIVSILELIARGKRIVNWNSTGSKGKSREELIELENSEASFTRKLDY